MGWWIFLGILVTLFLIPLGASIRYDVDGVRAIVICGPVRLTVFPMKKKDKKPKKEKKKKTKEPAEEAMQPEPSGKTSDKPAKKKTAKPGEKPGGPITDFLPLVELALKFVGEFFGKMLHIDVLYVKLTLGGGDPADLAINYGKAWTALGNLWPVLDRALTIKKRDIHIQCDFEADQTLVNARVDITLTLARLFGLVIRYGVKILVKFLKIQSKRKKANNPKQRKGGIEI